MSDRIERTPTGRRLAPPRTLLALVIAACCALGGARADPQGPTEFEVKAAYLYNLAKFVSWPTLAPGAELTVCVVGTDPFGPALDALAGRTVQDWTLRVLRGPGTREPGRCQLAFVAAPARDPALLAALAAAGTVTVSDAPDFMAAGGMVAIAIVDGHLQFEINLQPAEHSGVKFSAQLLKLARRVSGNN
jgi:hypothetical protein